VSNEKLGTEGGIGARVWLTSLETQGGQSSKVVVADLEAKFEMAECDKPSVGNCPSRCKWKNMLLKKVLLP